MSKKPLQKDLFEDGIFYYDLHNDPAMLGMWRDLLSTGDTFNWDGDRYLILDKKAADQHWIIERQNG